MQKFLLARMNHAFKLCLILAALFLSLSTHIIAQENEQIILSVQLTEIMGDYLNEDIFEAFEAAHPNVEVNPIYDNNGYIWPASLGIETHLEEAEQLSLKADVILTVASPFGWFSPETTRTGYFLDLLPLFNASATEDPSDYYASVWQAAQWDGGLWFLPTSAMIATMIYDVEAFDAASLAYPDENWTLDDFLHAVDTLAIRDASGYVTRPGFSSFNGIETALFSRFLDQALYDSNQFPPAPQLMRPDTFALANQWAPLIATGALPNFSHDYLSEFYLGSEPLRVAPLGAAYWTEPGEQLAYAPLPGGDSLVNPGGFAVSSRSQYPLLAYELAAYMAANSEIARAVMLSHGDTALARPEYAETLANQYILFNSVPQDIIPFVEDSLQNGLPSSETAYGFYLLGALHSAVHDDIDIETALGNAEALAIENLALAEARRSELVGIVATPVPELALPAGEIELRVFHFEGDESLWQAFADEFAANDPEVARIVLENDSTELNYRDAGTDCFYYSPYFAQTASEHFLNIAPLIAMDSDFNPDDWLRGVFDSVQRGESIFALPLDVRPLALWYDPEQLAAFELDVPLTSSELLDAMNVLGAGDRAALAAYELDTGLLVLLASYDALPIDYSRNPVQIDFVGENNFGAIEALLDLARDGIIKYSAITDFMGNNRPEFEPFLLDYLVDNPMRDADYLPIVFPAGNQYTAVHYRTMAGYISRYSEHPEACYRFLTSLSHRPDLLAGLPAQRSQAMRSDYASFYDDFNSQLNAPNLLILPSIPDYYTSYWLFRAFDRYVLEDADLLAELSAAEAFTRDYLACLERGGGFEDCARTVDPSAGE